MGLNVELLEQSFERVAPSASELATHFYGRLFDEHPEVRPLFTRPLEQQKRHLVASLAAIVGSLRQPEKLADYLGALAQRHVGYGVRREHYPIVGHTLVAALQDVAGTQWSDELSRAWSDAYQVIQAIVYDALDEAAASET